MVYGRPGITDPDDWLKKTDKKELCVAYKRKGKKDSKFVTAKCGTVCPVICKLSE